MGKAQLKHEPSLRDSQAILTIRQVDCVTLADLTSVPDA